MRMKSAGGGGEIIQVQGGHIVRSTGRKDRHSKVYTAKGPRDRRVRLSAHTAIQFYDVQDRLGYDRPSKAIDWLIKKAKSSIDNLAELPPWHPITGVAANNAEPDQSNPNEMVIAGGGEETESSGYNFHQLQRQMGENNNSNNNQANNVSSFNIPPSLDTIADTMKSFFPTSSVATSSINFHSYPPDHDLISRTTNLNPSQDLGLSLHSFQDQGLNIHHTHSQQSQGDTNHNSDQIQALFAAGVGGSTVGFNTSYQRMVAWSNQNRGGDGGFVFNSHSQALPQQAYAHAQGGTLQSSFSPSVSARAWNDSSIFGTQQRTQQQQQPMIHHSSIFGTRFASDGGLPVFCIPTRIHAEKAENGGVSDRPSSASSPNSTHH